MSAHRHPPLNVWDYERVFEQNLDAGAFGYFSGGADDEVTLRDNVAAFRRWRLRPRMLVDVSEPSIETTVLGIPVSMPLLVAPTAFQRMCHPDGEPATARAAAAADTIMTLSTIATAAPRRSGRPRPAPRAGFNSTWSKTRAERAASSTRRAGRAFKGTWLRSTEPASSGRASAA